MKHAIHCYETMTWYLKEFRESQSADREKEVTLEEAVEWIWCNARDDKPNEYFNQPLDQCTMDEITLLLDAAKKHLEERTLIFTDMNEDLSHKAAWLASCADDCEEVFSSDKDIDRVGITASAALHLHKASKLLKQARL